MGAVQWTEADDGVTASFEAVDQTKKETLDGLNFRRALTVGVEPEKGARKALSVLGLWTAVIIAVTTVMSWARGESPMAGYAVDLVALLFYGSIVAASLLRGRRVKGTVDARFTLKLTPSALTCSAGYKEVAHIATADIAEVTGGKRLTVVTQDAKAVTLPCVLDEPSHAAIAAELNARLRDLHARNADYRGVRIAEPTEEAAEEAADSENAEQRSSK